MARSLWSGAVSFGLVNIPVSIISAKQGDKLHFNLLDQRDFGRIGYRNYNKSTGKEVPKEEIVKAYEYDQDQFVVVDEEDFARANPRATQTIDIEDFIKIDEVDPLLFEQPYYLIPRKGGEKGYLLLRQVMERTKRVAVGRFVFRQKLKLVCIMAKGNYLVLEMMRYAREILTVDEIKELDNQFDNVKISKAELQMAEQLVDGLSGEWDPYKYEDTYYDDLMKVIEGKVKKGGLVEAEPIPDEVSYPKGRLVDLMPLLKQSLEKANKKGRRKKSA